MIKDKLLIYVIVSFMLLVTISSGYSATKIQPRQINMTWDNFNLSLGALVILNDLIIEGDYIEIRGGYVNGSMIPFVDDTFSLGNSSNGFKSLWLHNSGTTNSIFIDQDGDGISLNIDSETTSTNTIQISNAVTTGKAIKIYNNAEFTQSEGIINIEIDNVASTGSVIAIQNDGTGADIVTLSNQNLTFLPHGVGITIIGDAADYDSLTATNDDLFISGELEVDGFTHLDGALFIDSPSAGDSISIKVGGVTYFVFRPSLDDGMHLAPRGGEGQMNNNIIITTFDDKAKDFDHDVTSPDPTLFIHSSTDPDMRNDAYLGLTFAGNETANITTGAGNITLVPYDEYIFLNYGMALSQNGSCTFIWSPDGSTKTEVCNS
ncbi:MAG: hypothetical protein ACTSQY_03285 [Candidatus Odinarchaeia archaeon]